MTRDETIQAWAEIAIKEWIQKISSLGIGHTDQLVDSLAHTAYTNSGGDISRVVFLFNYYGKFVEMGVGRAIPYDWAGSSSVQRTPKPWYTRTFRAEVHRLRELLQEKYANDYKRVIVATINEEHLIGAPLPSSDN